jgi:hypothetical protein
MNNLFRSIAILFLLGSAPLQAVTVLTVFTIYSRTNIDFTRPGVDQKVASFLIPNPTLVTFESVFSFAHNCNVQHFTSAATEIPLTKVRIAVNGGPQQDLWTRAASDCTGSLSWSPPDPSPAPYADKYQIDLYVSWDAVSLKLAGQYLETMAVNAYIP